MASAGKNRKIVGDKYPVISVQICKYECFCSAGFNINLNKRDPSPNQRIFGFTSSIEIMGTCIAPDEHISEQYEITIYGEVSDESPKSTVAKDYQSYDTEAMPIYRKKHGGYFPVYKLPSGLGLLNRVRGTKGWYGSFRAPHESVISMTEILNSRRLCYLSLTEHKIGRTRWIHYFSLQTKNPEDD